MRRTPYVVELAMRIAAIVLGALACGAAFNTFRADRLDWMENGVSMSLADAQTAVAGRTRIILDARSAEEFETAHLPGAVSLPYARRQTAFEDVVILLDPRQPIMVYCQSPSYDDAAKLARFLHDQGYPKVAVFTGGIARWLAAGQPLESDQPPTSH